MSRQALRRIPLEKFIDLKIDFAFKQLFGSERNKEITVVFLNAILQRTGRNVISEIVFVNQEVGGDYVDDKQSRLDIVVRTQADELVNVEMQLSNQHDMMKRTLYYWSKLFVDQLLKGKGYHTLRPTITVNICNFTQFPNTKNYHTTYHLCEDELKERLAPNDDVLEVRFIEMNKFIAAWHNEELDAFGDILVRWLLLLGMVDARKQKVYDEIYSELEGLAMKDEKLLAAFEAWDSGTQSKSATSMWQRLSDQHRVGPSQTPDKIIAYHSRLKTIIDEEARIDAARHYGWEDGKEEVVRNLLALGVDLATIQAASGLTEQQISQIKQQVDKETQGES